ncbi:hypothetical protein C0995_011487 [Termitomyces sp. Mi166|nr:hypothetical protein C0995_011487 [Termitomyces sp. Mi166\
MVLVLSVPKPIPKLIVALASPIAVPSTAPIAPSSASKPAAATPLSNPAPVKSTMSAIKGVRQFKLVGTEESSVLIINQATEVPITQETLQDEESSDKDNDEDSNDNEDGKGDDDNSDNDIAAMDIDSTKHPEETQPTVPTKAVTEVKALAPVPVGLSYFV